MSSNDSKYLETVYFSNGRRVQKKKFTKDYKRVNIFVKQHLQTFGHRGLHSKQRLYNRLDSIQMKPKTTPMTPIIDNDSSQIVSPKYTGSINEESTTFTSSPDDYNPYKAKIFRLKTEKRRFWSPGVERSHYGSSQSKAIDAIDKILKFHQ